jgi:xylulose-5-phosphate/fructose-6-phosphate phosphoketolase
MEDAIEHCRAGVSIWRWAGNEPSNGREPDIVLASSGNEVTTEIIAAAQMLIKMFPNITVRVVNITDLMILEGDAEHPHGLSEELYNGLFPPKKPVIYNFHGYPSVVKQLIFSRKNAHSWEILGYQEEGTTTTPFNMLIVNGTSRFHIAMLAIKKLSVDHKSVADDAAVKMANIKHELRLVREYITEHNTDPIELLDFKVAANKPVE